MQSLERPGAAGVSVYVQASRPGFVPTHPLAPDFPAGGIGFPEARGVRGLPRTGRILVSCQPPPNSFYYDGCHYGISVF